MMTSERRAADGLPSMCADSRLVNHCTESCQQLSFPHDPTHVIESMFRAQHR